MALSALLLTVLGRAASRGFWALRSPERRPQSLPDCSERTESAEMAINGHSATFLTFLSSPEACSFRKGHKSAKMAMNGHSVTFAYLSGRSCVAWGSGPGGPERRPQHPGKAYKSAKMAMNGHFVTFDTFPGCLEVAKKAPLASAGEAGRRVHGPGKPGPPHGLCFWALRAQKASLILPYRTQKPEKARNGHKWPFRSFPVFCLAVREDLRRGGSGLSRAQNADLRLPGYDTKLEKALNGLSDLSRLEFRRTGRAGPCEAGDCIPEVLKDLSYASQSASRLLTRAPPRDINVPPRGLQPAASP